MQLDKYDKKIAALLVKDARQSVSDISRQVNLSRSAVTDRIKRMEINGYITGYHAHLAQDSEQAVSAYFALSFRPLACEQLMPLIEAIPEIKLAHSISGDVDLILLVEAPNMARLNGIRSEMDQWPNVNKVVTHMCLMTRVARF